MHDATPPCGCSSASGVCCLSCICVCVCRLRNAVHYQPIKVAAALSAVSKALIAPVIVFGPVLALTAAVIMFGSHNPAAMAQGPRIRLASTAVSDFKKCLTVCLSSALAQHQANRLSKQQLRDVFFMYCNICA